MKDTIVVSPFKKKYSTLRDVWRWFFNSIYYVYLLGYHNHPVQLCNSSSHQPNSHMNETITLAKIPYKTYYIIQINLWRLQCNDTNNKKNSNTKIELEQINCIPVLKAPSTVSAPYIFGKISCKGPSPYQGNIFLCAQGF